MRKILIMLSLFWFVGAIQSQSENELVNMIARICQTDSASKVLGVLSEDSSIVVFNYQTPDYDVYGANSYQYEKFELVFDVSSSLLFGQIPFGKIDVIEHSKKNARLVIEIAGAGNREKKQLWTFAVYDFERPKNGGQWLLKKVDYHYDDYFNGKELK